MKLIYDVKKNSLKADYCYENLWTDSETKLGLHICEEWFEEVKKKEEGWVSDLENEADYSAKSIGASYHKYGNYKNMTEDEQNKVYNTTGLAPSLSIPVKGDGSSTTKSVVAAGTIDIRENKAQDISALSRDTANSLNELGKIFEETWLESQATG